MGRITRLDFQIKTGPQNNNEQPISNDPTSPVMTDAHTDPETPGAVASDADGDHVVVWTAEDAATPPWTGFTSQSTVATMNSSARSPPCSALPERHARVRWFGGQRYASVASDADGDFVVTWTQYDASGNTDIYARRFSANGVAEGDAVPREQLHGQ